MTDETPDSLSFETTPTPEVPASSRNHGKRLIWCGALGALLVAVIMMISSLGQETAIVTLETNTQERNEDQEKGLNTKVETVVLSFRVPPTKGFRIMEDRNARRLLPPNDIFIKKMTFVGVEVDGERIPFHNEIYEDEEETKIKEGILYSFHHTTFHQGHQGKSPAMWDEFHNNPPFVLGTHPHTTDYGKYGIRVRSDTNIIACNHPMNHSPDVKVFDSIWRVEYIDVDETKNLQRASSTAETEAAYPAEALQPLVVSWFHVAMPRGAKVGEHYAMNLDMTFHKDVEVVGVLYHHHPWARQMDVYDTHDTLIYSHDGTPVNDGSIDFYDEPVPVTAGNTVKFAIQARAGFETDLSTPTAIHLFTKVGDGSDRIETQPAELYTVTRSSTLVPLN